MMMVRLQLAAVGGETRTDIRRNKYHKKCNKKYDEIYHNKYKRKQSDLLSNMMRNVVNIKPEIKRKNLTF